MIASGKPRKQRFFRFNAPLHVRQHFLHAHVDKALRKKLNINKRSVQISRGDTVKVVSGGKKGATGKVIRVNLRTGRISIDSLTKKNARGKEHNIQINASNVYITDLNLNDKFRAARLKVARVETKKEEKPAAKQRKETEENALQQQEEKTEAKAATATVAAQNR